jgi:ATP-dependent RNA helicase MSS116
LVDLIDNEGVGSHFTGLGMSSSKCRNQVTNPLATLVLDEADRLLDQGFRPELIKILGALPNREVSKRQTLLFTATVPDGIRKLGHASLAIRLPLADCQIASIALNPNHQFITTLAEDANNTHEHVTQEILVVDFNDIIAGTYEVLRREAEKGNLKGESHTQSRVLILSHGFPPHRSIRKHLQRDL